mgnify:CR=1 FL=1
MTNSLFVIMTAFNAAYAALKATEWPDDVDIAVVEVDGVVFVSINAGDGECTYSPAAVQGAVNEFLSKPYDEKDGSRWDLFVLGLGERQCRQVIENLA